MSLKTLSAADFIPFNLFEETYPVKTDVVYAQANHPDNHFPGLYHPDAKWLWAHKDIVPIVLLAALICEKNFGWTLDLKDCLRFVEAQKKMAVFNCDPALVMPEGTGAHPRGMAGDIQPRRDGMRVDMGTPYDYFAADLTNNPAARDYKNFGDETETILARREALTEAMTKAAAAFGKRILPYPHEWWDYRFFEDVWGQYQPAREADFPSYMRLVGKPTPIPVHVMQELKREAAGIDEQVCGRAETLGIKRNVAALVL